MKKFFTGFLLLVGVLAGLAISACTDADIASRNLSTAADNFEVNRRIAFYNGITDTYILEVVGLCSLGNDTTATEVNFTCQVGPGVYKKHFLGLSDNVTYLVEQLEPQPVSTYHYRVTFKPQALLPDIDFRGDLGELMTPTP